LIIAFSGGQKTHFYGSPIPGNLSSTSFGLEGNGYSSKLSYFCCCSSFYSYFSIHSQDTL